MRLIILTAEQENFVPQQLKKAGEAKGFEVELIDTDACYINISNESYISYNGTKFTGADWCIPRMSEENMEYKIAIMDHLHSMGVKLLNTPRGMRLASNKLETQIILDKAGIKTPKTVMITNDSQLDYAVKALDEKFPMIVKTLFGTHGVGVIRADSLPSLRSIVQQLLKSGNEFLIQEFIEHSQSARIIMMDGEMLTAGMRQIPNGDFRSNAHQGAEIEKYSPKQEEIDIAKKCAELIGTPFSAVDYIVLEDGTIVVLEINGSPGFEAMQKVTDFDIAEKIIDHLLSGAKDAEAAVSPAEAPVEAPKPEPVEAEKTESTEIEAAPIEQEEEKSQDDVLGTIASVIIKNFNDDKPIDARVDTGATLCCVHGSDIEVGENYVKFRFNDMIYKFRLARTTKVKKAGSDESEERPVICVDIELNGKVFRDIDFTVSNRDNMKYDVLLGRSALEMAGFLIDPAATSDVSMQKKSEEE